MKQDPIKTARQILTEVVLARRIPGQAKTEAQKFVRVDCVLPPDIKSLLDMVSSDKKRGRSAHIERALRLYLTVLGFERAKKSPEFT